jgi:hypothetical protein
MCGEAKLLVFFMIDSQGAQRAFCQVGAKVLPTLNGKSRPSLG